MKSSVLRPGPDDPGDTTAPTVDAFVAAGGISPLAITSFTASDDVGVTGYAITEVPTPPAAGAASWSATPPTEYATDAVGAISLYPWAIDAAGNVSPVFGPVAVTVEPPGPPDDVAPTVTAFVVANGTTSPLTITTFTATDNVGVTGYAITESPTPPAASSGKWSASAPTRYATWSTGPVTLYPWARDAHRNVSPVFGSPVTVTLVAPERQLSVGTNLNWFISGDPGKMPADLILGARPWATGSGNGDNGPSSWAPLDAKGWPQVTAGTGFGVVVENAPWPGIYRLTFTNRNASAAGDTPTTGGYSNVVIRRPSDSTHNTPGCDYASGTRVSTCDVIVTSFNNASFIWLNWSGSTGGVTDVHLMRPLKGGTGFHTVGTILADYIVDRLQWFSTIRTMQLSGGTGTGHTTGEDTTWSDRTSPWGPQTRSRGSPGHVGGLAWENNILLANQIQRDLWITLPFNANDAYIRNVARVFKCGSDGSLPWTTSSGTTDTCAAGTPPFPPLDPNLKLYVEHGNEIWNNALGYWEGDNERAAGTAVCTWGDPYKLNAVIGTQPANDSPNGSCPNQANPGWGWRRTGYLAVRQSMIFRSVFGDAQMMTRIRPVLATQHGRYPTSDMPLRYIESVWGATYTTGNAAYDNLGNVDNTGTYPNPRQPVSYYIYALATAPYFPGTNAASDSSCGGLDASSPASMLSSTYAETTHNAAGCVIQAISDNAARAAARSIKFVAYEGGDNLIPELMSGGASATNVSNAVLASYHPTTGARMGASISGGLPAADQTNYVYGSVLAAWGNQPNTEVYVHFTLDENAGSGSMFGLCPPTSRSDILTIPGWSASMGTSGSDCRFEWGPKWDALKAFSRAWTPQ